MKTLVEYEVMYANSEELVTRMLLLEGKSLEDIVVNAKDLLEEGDPEAGRWIKKVMTPKESLAWIDDQIKEMIKRRHDREGGGITLDAVDVMDLELYQATREEITDSILSDNNI